MFLDEVAELPLTTQARLLRVLESGEFLKVGSSVVQKTDVRIVAATNVNLLQAVKQGKFREDLYYRLSTVTIAVPNLHDRGDDIHLLARKFASDFSRKYMTEPISFSPDAVRALEIYRWPGNVRQLKNIVDQLSLFHAGEEISRSTVLDILPIDHSGLSTPVPAHKEVDHEAERKMLWQLVLSLKAEVEALRNEIGPKNQDFTDVRHTTDVKSLVKYPDSDLLGLKPRANALEEAERQAVIDALSRNNGDKHKTAKDLNISLRTLYRKIQDYDIQV